MDKYSRCAITIYTFQLDVLMTRMGRREMHVSNKLAIRVFIQMYFTREKVSGRISKGCVLLFPKLSMAVGSAYWSCYR